MREWLSSTDHGVVLQFDGVESRHDILRGSGQAEVLLAQRAYAVPSKTDSYSCNSKVTTLVKNKH